MEKETYYLKFFLTNFMVKSGRYTIDVDVKKYIFKKSRECL